MAVPQYDRHGNVLNTTRPVYQGYMVDLIRELARVAGFKYTLKREPENKYGHRTTTGWDGIIGAVMQKVRKGREHTCFSSSVQSSGFLCHRPTHGRVLQMNVPGQT